MEYHHNQICTHNHEVEVGKQYDYREDAECMRVVVLSDTSDKEGLKFRLRVISEPRGMEFDVFAAPGYYAYNGMWRLWDAGEYIHGNFALEEVIPDGQLVGFSVSSCIASICRNNIPLERVDRIYGGTKAEDSAAWERVIAAYCNTRWTPFVDRAAGICRTLVQRGKIIQPRLSGEPTKLMVNVWEKA